MRCAWKIKVIYQTHINLISQSDSDDDVLLINFTCNQENNGDNDEPTMEWSDRFSGAFSYNFSILTCLIWILLANEANRYAKSKWPNPKWNEGYMRTKPSCLLWQFLFIGQTLWGPLTKRNLCLWHNTKTQGELGQKQKGNLVATVWHDNRTVTLLTTNASPSEVTSVRWRQKTRELQLRASYCIGRKFNKW